MAAANAIRVTSISGALTVTFTAASGATPKVYTSSALTTTVSLPATVTTATTTTFYFPAPGQYQLSVKNSDGAEIANDAGTTHPVDLQGSGVVQSLSYDTRSLVRDGSGDTGRFSDLLSATHASATYVGMVAAPTGVAATDSAALQGAHTALPAGGGLLLMQNGGYALATTTLAFTKPVTQVGFGGRLTRLGGPAAVVRAVTTITYTGATGDAITSSSAGYIGRDFAVVNEAATQPTAGTGIHLTGGSTAELDTVSVVGFYDNVVFDGESEYFTLDSCQLYDPVRYGLYVNNTLAWADNADFGVNNCVISTYYRTWSGAAAIRWRSGGGGRITNNKINGGGLPNVVSGTAKFEVGIDLMPGDGVGTGDFTIHGNSVANTTVACIRLGLEGTTGGITSTSIVGNNLNSSTGDGIIIQGGPAGNADNLRGITIEGNAFANLTGRSITADLATSVHIGPNTHEFITGQPIIRIGNGVSWGLGVVDLSLEPQNYKDDPAYLIQDMRSLNSFNVMNGVVRHEYRRQVVISATNTWQRQFTVGLTGGSAGVKLRAKVAGLNGATGGVYKEQVRTAVVDASIGSYPVVTTIGADISQGAGAPQIAVQYTPTIAGEVQIDVQVTTGAADPNFYGSCEIEVDGNVASIQRGQ